MARTGSEFKRPALQPAVVFFEAGQDWLVAPSVASNTEIEHYELMASLRPLRKALLSELERTLLLKGMERRRVREGMFDSVAFIARDEVSLVLTPHLSIRYRQLHLESTISVVDCEFERSVGCEPFTLCSLQTFSALHANFAEFNENAWIRPGTASDDLRRALTPYLDLIARYPRARKALATDLRSGEFTGLPIRAFMLSARANAYITWLNTAVSQVLH